MKVTLVLLVVVSVALAQRGGPFSNWFRDRNSIFSGISRFRPLSAIMTPWSKVAVQTPEVSNSIDEHEEQEDNHEDNHEEKHEEGGHGHAFGYHDTSRWAIDFPTCAGQRQSPIDLKLQDMTPLDLSAIKFINYWKTPKTLKLINNGHSFEMKPTFAPNEAPTMTGGPLGNDNYQLEQIHGHWGQDDNSGSEHTVDGQSSAMELHMVHWNTKYPSFGEAASKPDGLAVMGQLYTASNEPNEVMDDLLTQMTRIEGSDPISIDIDPMPINVFQVDNKASKATYKGSLTTPPCTESVTWIMSLKKHRISSEQLDILRNIVKVVGEDGQEENLYNFRDVQELNGRQVGLLSA